MALKRFQNKLASQGEALTGKDLRMNSAEGSNGAPEIMLLSPRLTKGEILPLHPPHRMKLTESGAAIVGFRQPDWTEDNHSFHWEQLENELSANRETLDRIQSCLSAPVLDHHLDYSGGPKMRLPELLVAKNLTYWFGSECQLALHTGKLDQGLQPLLTQIRLSRFLENDRIMISELVRMALCAIARTDTWEALQAEGWSDDQLRQIQEAWQEGHYLGNFTRSLNGERVFAAISFDQCRRSNEDAFSMIFWMDTFAGTSEPPVWEQLLRGFIGERLADFLKKQVYCRLWRFAWLDQCETRYLEGVQNLIEISMEAETNKSFNAARTKDEFVTGRPYNRNFYDALRYPSGLDSARALSRGIRRAMLTETERSLALAAIALKRYSLKNSIPPASLDLLVPDYLDAVPIDFMDGKALKYRIRKEGAPVLYSVGEDGIDENGDSTLPNHAAITMGTWARKDVVWPTGIGQ